MIPASVRTMSWHFGFQPPATPHQLLRLKIASEMTKDSKPGVYAALGKEPCTLDGMGHWVCQSVLLSMKILAHLYQLYHHDLLQQVGHLLQTSLQDQHIT